ncbi:glycosyltransferase [Atopobacter phocae]|uniref:glycosyltransferase n=1 Tax=Atopobacter phocae TaxID=136492 RepID=UPI00047179C2|nr:glycosyltransferase [Atopobacter phocae]
MRVGIFTDTYIPQINGVTTSVHILRNELEQLGHQVYIFTTTDPDQTDDPNVCRLKSIPLLSFKDRRIAISGLMKAIKMGKQWKLDIVHTQTEFSLGFVGRMVAMELGVPLIHTYHTMYERYLHYVFNGKLIKSKHVKEMTRFYCDRTDSVIVPSQLTKEKLRSYGVLQQIFVVPTGVPIPEFSSENRQVMREQFGYNDKDIVLLSLSRLSPEKNIEAIINQLPAIIALVPEVKLLIIGDGPSRKNLEQLTVKNHVERYVHFVGEVPHSEAYAYYQMSDLYVNTSDSETQGLTYIEAVVNNLPIIAKQNTYLNQIITDRSLGQLYQSTQSFAITTADYLMNDLKRSRNQSDAREQLKNEISSRTFALRILDVYTRAIDSQPFKKRRKRSRDRKGESVR